MLEITLEEVPVADNEEEVAKPKISMIGAEMIPIMIPSSNAAANLRRKLA